MDIMSDNASAENGKHRNDDYYGADNNLKSGIFVHDGSLALASRLASPERGALRRRPPEDRCGLPTVSAPSFSCKPSHRSTENRSCSNHEGEENAGTPSA
jgi:hypothetical protein